MILSFYDLRRRKTSKLSLLPVIAFILILTLATPAKGFTFRFSSTPSQCMGTSAIWTSGRAPYTLLLLPIGFLPQGQEKRVIFEKSVNQGTEMAFNFPYPRDTKFVAVMSDATGFGTGGTSPVLTVSSSNTTSCLPTTPSTPQFYLYLSPTTPSQCSPISLSWDTPRNPPVNIYGVIPQGESFRINPPAGGGEGSGFDWTCNIRSGTPFFFVAGDGNGSGTGGSTDVSPVGAGGGGGSGCINAASPSSTPDASVGSVGPLPTGGGGDGSGGGGGGGTVTGTGVATATATATNGVGGGQDGGGNGTGGSTADGNGNGGGVGGGGNTDGSGGGTVHGPLDPTTIAGVGNTDTHGPNIPLILGIIFGLLALAALITLLLFYHKRRKTALARRDNQRARLLAAGDFSDTHLPQSDRVGDGVGGGGGVAGMAEVDRTGNGRGGRSPLDLPHPRPAFAARPWAGGSLESLTSGLRSTPFIWPLGSGGSGSGSAANSPVSSSDRRTPRDRDAHDGGSEEVAAVGASTARPALERGLGSSSGMLRRLRSVRYGGGGGGSGFSFGFPFGGGGGGYRSLGDGESPGGDETTPSSGLRNTTTNDSSGAATAGTAGTGHVTTPSGDSNASEMHKSPLPPSYMAQQYGHGVQHASQNSHGSNNSRFSSQPGIPSQPPPGVGVDPAIPALTSSIVPGQDPLSRPGAAPLGPRSLLGGRRPSLEREDTGGSVWEVPPTYASLQGRRGLGRHD